MNAAKSFLAAFAAVLCPPAVLAGQVAVTGHTEAYFVNNAGAPYWQYLTFYTNTFSFMPDATGHAGPREIGYFTLGACDVPWYATECTVNYAEGHVFHLWFDFAGPQNAASTPFFGSVYGSTTSYDPWGSGDSWEGSVRVWFEGQDQTVNYTNSQGFGTFTIRLSGGQVDGPAYYYQVPVLSNHTPVNAEVIDASFTPWPEPATMVLIGAGLLSIGLWRLRA